jgi:hypothetical protein
VIVHVLRGQPSPEELAALVAVLLSPAEQPPESPYNRWRRTRLAALRADPTRPARPGEVS